MLNVFFASIFIVVVVVAVVVVVLLPHIHAHTLNCSFITYMNEVCWVPFFCVNIVAAFCKTCIGGQTFKILSWLGYSNSAFNPIIYSIFNTEFREAFKRILTTKAVLCCTEDINYHCRNSERFVTDYQSAKCSHIHSGRSSADLEQVSAI